MGVKHTRTTLSNGLPLVVIEVPGSNAAVVSYWIKAGSRMDPKNREGMAHFLEHVLLKGGTRNYPDYQKMSEELESVGAWRNAWTSNDYVSYATECATKDVELVMRLMSEVRHPLFKRKNIENDREVILKEQIRRDDDPDMAIWDEIVEQFFAGTPFATRVVGTASSVKSIKREDILSFWQNNYLINNSLLLISGGVKAAQVLKFAEKFFGKLVTRDDSWQLPAYKYERTKPVHIRERNIPQTMVALSFRTDPGYGEGNEDAVLYLILAALTFGWTSRLAKRLRLKESLVYTWAGNKLTLPDTGLFVIRTPTAHNKVPQLISSLSDEIRILRDKGIGNAELKKVRGYVESRLLYKNETAMDFMEWYGFRELLFPDQVESIQERIARIKKVSSEDIKRVADKYFTNDNWYLTIRGKAKESDIEVNL